jgi:hypothetical protein
VFKTLQPDGYFSASNVKDVAESVIGQLPLPGIESSPLNPGEIWALVIFAAVKQTSVWDSCTEMEQAPCDDTVMEWLHTLNRGWLEFAAVLHDPPKRLATMRQRGVLLSLNSTLSRRSMLHSPVGTSGD